MYYSFASFNFFLFGMASNHGYRLWPGQSKHRCQITSVKIILWIHWDTHVLWVVNFRLPSPFYQFVSNGFHFDINWFSSRKKCGVGNASEPGLVFRVRALTPTNYAVSRAVCGCVISGIWCDLQQMLICFPHDAHKLERHTHTKSFALAFARANNAIPQYVAYCASKSSLIITNA